MPHMWHIDDTQIDNNLIQRLDMNDLCIGAACSTPGNSAAAGVYTAANVPTVPNDSVYMTRDSRHMLALDSSGSVMYRLPLVHSRPFMTYILAADLLQYLLTSCNDTASSALSCKCSTKNRHWSKVESTDLWQ